MDLVALPSSWEGMPNVILEAMACGKPAVATNVGGCAELIVEGETGFLAPPATKAALADVHSAASARCGAAPTARRGCARASRAGILDQGDGREK